MVQSAKVHNLPTQLTPFIGRTQELTEIIELLADPDCRLLTLVGTGGIGKTRLALQAAAEIGEDFAHGVYFVPLQSVSSVDFLVPAVANAVNFVLSGQQDPQEQLLNYLHDKEVLLLLDNFEQLLTKGGALFLSTLIETAPALKLLVTSREVLNLQEEWLYPVRGLSVPPSTQTGALEAYGAVQLFVERARRVRRDFSLAEEQAGVVRLCQLVEGMPLALELAASWLKTLRCAAIVAEIQRNLDFLTTPLRNIPDRHRSMQAVFDHSWKLLSSTEQDVFKRLAVFRGGFQCEAAQQVTGGTLPILSALVDQSLLRRENGGRYQIHELLRQYAEEQLQNSPEENVRIHEAHCAYYVDFLYERYGDVNGGRQQEASAEIEIELENIRAAWQWAVDQAKIEALHQSAGTFFYFCQLQSRYLEGADALAKAVQVLDRQPSTERCNEALAMILDYLGWLCLRLGRLERAEEVLERSRTLFQRYAITPLPGMGTDPLTPLGVLALIKGDYTRAIELGETARRESEARDDPWNLMFAFYISTGAATAQGQYQAARAYAQQAVGLARSLKSHWFMAYCLNEWGEAARASGNYEEARRHFQASYEIRQTFNDPEGVAVALNHLGEIAILQTDYHEAQQLYQQSLALYRNINDRGGVATSLYGLGKIAYLQGDYPLARQQFRQALQIAMEIQFLSLVLSILISIAELLLQATPPEKGVSLLALALHHPASNQETKARAQHLLEEHKIELAPELFATAMDEGQNRELSATVASLQVELTQPLLPAEKPEPAQEDRAGTPNSTGLIEPLTDRELEVLQLIAQGWSNRQIADELVLTVGTIKWYASQIYSKLNVQNRTQAATRAQELNLLS